MIRPFLILAAAAASPIGCRAFIVRSSGSQAVGSSACAPPRRKGSSACAPPRRKGTCFSPTVAAASTADASSPAAEDSSSSASWERTRSSTNSSSQSGEKGGAACPTDDDDDDDDDNIFAATSVLAGFDAAQQEYVTADGSRGMGGGTSALAYLQGLSASDRSAMRDAVRALVARAASERADDSSRGRVMMGFCAENAPEALAGLRTWVSGLSLPRGMLHGMDVDGVPIDPVELGCVYVKYSTGGAMTFSEMRKSGLGFDALWRPGDALLEPYDGDFRGVYLNVELGDGVFRQFGVLPTDLFMEEEVW